MNDASNTSKRIVIRDGMPFTETEKGMHRSSVAELVSEIERLRSAHETSGCAECKAEWALDHDQYCTSNKGRQGETGGGLPVETCPIKPGYTLLQSFDPALVNDYEHDGEPTTMCRVCGSYQIDKAREALLARAAEKASGEVYTQEALDAAHARTRERLSKLKIDRQCYRPVNGTTFPCVLQEGHDGPHNFAEKASALALCDCDNDFGCKEYDPELFRCKNDEAEKTDQKSSACRYGVYAEKCPKHPECPCGWHDKRAAEQRASENGTRQPCKHGNTHGQCQHCLDAL